MPNTTYSNMYYLGNFADVDPNEADYNSENAGSLVGVSASNSGVLELVTITNYDSNDDAAIFDNDVNGTNSAGDTMTYSIVGGPATTRLADSTITGTATVTLGDGTIVNANVLMVQANNGDLFVTNLSGSTTLNNQNIQNIQITSISSANFAGYFTSQTTTNGGVVCFASGTLITTKAGDVSVENLVQGDLVLTVDNGFQPIRWIGSNLKSTKALEETPSLRPVRIRAGALGDGLPTSDLLVSPQHRVLVSSAITQRMFNKDEVLVAAKQLVMLDGIDIAHDVESVEYFHFLFDQHELVISNGATTESLYTGPEALKSVSTAAHDEILALFPELSDINYEAPPVLKLVKGRQGRQLAVRHKNNKKCLQQYVH